MINFSSISQQLVAVACLLACVAGVAPTNGQSSTPKPLSVGDLIAPPAHNSISSPSGDHNTNSNNRNSNRQQSAQEFEELHEHDYKQAPDDNKGLWPLVNVDRTENKSEVAVHVPIFFDMDTHHDAQSGHNKLDLSVLHGLVTVSRDKVRDQEGQLNGPVKVTVFGIPVYNSRGRAPSTAHEPSQAAAARRSPGVASSVEHLTHGAEDALQRTEDKVMGTFTGMFDRLSRVIRPAHETSSSSSAGSGSQQASVGQDSRQQQSTPVKSYYAASNAPSSAAEDIFNKSKLQQAIDSSHKTTTQSESQKASDLTSKPIK